jgi:hypothetical protein
MDKTTTVFGNKRPYKPSWIDRYNSWVEKQPARPWMYYILFGVVLVGIQLLFLWLESDSPETQLALIILFNGLFTPFLLALIHFLDNQAVTALKTMRPVLDTSESEFDQYEYALANMPALPSLGVGLAMLVLVILMEVLWVVPGRYSPLAQLPVFTVIFQVVDKSSAFLFGVFIYHTIRQLRLVNAIHAHQIRINLLNLAPSRAFSRLTAATAVGLVIGVYGWMLINPDLLADPMILGLVAIVTILAASVFVWPLYGVHRSIEVAKEKALQEIDLRFQTVFKKFNQLFQEDDFPAIDRLNGTITSLEIQHRRIKAIPTWPWNPETAQIVVSAIAVPLILAIIRVLIEQVIG